MDTTQISRRQILVVGSCNTDMVIKAAHLPRPGETILGGTFFMNPGGKGANQAVAIARLGGSVTFICKTGSDIFGHQSQQLFEEEGINTSFVFSSGNVFSSTFSSRSMRPSSLSSILFLHSLFLIHLSFYTCSLFKKIVPQTNVNFK